MFRLSDPITDIALLELPERLVATLELRPLAEIRYRGAGDGDREPLRPHRHRDDRDRQRPEPDDALAERDSDGQHDPDRRLDQPWELWWAADWSRRSSARRERPDTREHGRARLVSSGLGFAVPADTVRALYDEICETGEIGSAGGSIGVKLQFRSFHGRDRSRWSQKGGAVLTDDGQRVTGTRLGPPGGRRDRSLRRRGRPGAGRDGSAPESALHRPAPPARSSTCARTRCTRSRSHPEHATTPEGEEQCLMRESSSRSAGSSV